MKRAEVVSRARLLGLDGSAFVGPHAGPAWFHNRLALIRSDATALILIDPTTGDFGRVSLSPPATELELAACFTVERAGRPFLVAFGPKYVLTLRFVAPRTPQIRLVPWSAQEVRAVARLSSGVVRIFGVATTSDLALAPLLAELDAADALTAIPTSLAAHDVGPHGFVGASACGDEVFCIDADRVGVFEARGRVRWAPLGALRLPPRGLALEPTNRRRAYVVTSEELLTIALRDGADDALR